MSPLPPTRERPITGGSASSPFGSGMPPKRSALRRWGRRIGIFLVIVLAVMLGALAAFAWYAKHEIDDLVTPRTAAMRKAQAELSAPLPGKPTNILLLGSDHRSGTADTDRRSDTLLIVRLDPTRKTISMLSFPRDTYVDIPGHGKSKINDAYALGGPALSVKTIKQLTGLDVNFVVDVDFKGFRGVVDSFGGIWVDVDQRYYVPESASYMSIDLQPGYQLLDGRDALAFARHRHSDSDFHRIARQQLVVSGLKKQIAQTSKRNSIPTLFKVLRDNTEIAAGGEGNSVPARVIYDYMRLATSLSPKDVYQIEFKGGTGEAGGASIVTYDPADLEKAVNAFLAPSSKARSATADQLVGKQSAQGGASGQASDQKEAKPAAPDPSTISVKVLNGSGTAGVAGEMSDQLAAIGYKVDPNPSNADNANYASTRVLYADDSLQAAAQALADRIPGASTGPKDASNPFTTKLLVIVGKTGTSVESDGDTGVVGVDGGPEATGGTAEGNEVPEQQEAQVTTDPEAAKPAFFEMGAMKLPILYPTVIPTGSSFEGAYGYQLTHGRKTEDAYRLVGKLQTGIDYWGLQGLTWSKPPILDDPTRTVTRKGRTYRLYFNGTKLHMIAWTQGIGTYWVANSVLDKLSNEDMLAIADGVKLLPKA